MNTKKTTVFENGLIWFGAAVSIAELLTGALIAPLGFGKGLAAILLGHAIGCALLYLAGLMGAKKGLSAMETVKLSFGKKGGIFFALMNVLQLLGWTAIMIKQGAGSAAAAAGIAGIFNDYRIWAVVIGLLILAWIVIGVTNLGKINAAVITLLFVLTILLSAVVFRSGDGIFSGGAFLAGDSLNAGDGDGQILSFGAAVELSAAMPVSWLPVISDYTRKAAKPKAASGVSAGVYFLGSCWMFIIGMAAAIFTGSGDIAGIMLGAGLGAAGLLIVILSTVTTTFLDAYSAGVSSVSIYGKIKEKSAAVAITIFGTLLAVFAPVDRMEAFLYLIGSVFAPMIAILISDVFILKRDSFEKIADARNAVIWVIGFIIYRIFLNIETYIGNTLPVIAIVMLLCVAVEFILRILSKK